MSESGMTEPGTSEPRMSQSTRGALANGLRLMFALGAAILVDRAIFGPLTFPVPVRSPINLEGGLVIAAGVLIAMGWRTGVAKPTAPEGPGLGAPARRGLHEMWVVLSLATLIAVVFAGSIRDYFLADDFLLLKYARDFSWDLHREFTTPGGDGFFRPVTHLVFGLIYRWAHFDPLRWHVAGFVLHAINATLLFVILRRMGLARAAAWLASALFAIHATRPETVVWVGGRFDLVATFFVLLSVALFLESLDARGAVRWILWGAALAASVLGVLSKESAYAGPPILVLMALARRAPWRGLVASVAPFFCVAAALFAYRWVLFGSIGGYLDASGRPQALLLSPLNVIKALAFRIWAVLVLPVDWNAGATPALGFGLGAAMLAYLAALLWMTTARVPRRDLAAPVGFIVLASIPPLQQLLIGPDMEKARYLYLPAAGFCWLLAVIVQSLETPAQRAVWAAILIFNLAALGNNLSAWHFASRQARSACIAAASCAREGNHRLLAAGLPRTVRGAPLFAWGFEDCTRMQMEAGAPLEVEMRSTPVSEEESARYACVLQWDPMLNELRRIH